MIQVKETEENPICPHCQNQIKELLSKRIGSAFGVKFIYFCGTCKKVLGLSHRKGFWMG